MDGMARAAAPVSNVRRVVMGWRMVSLVFNLMAISAGLWRNRTDAVRMDQNRNARCCPPKAQRGRAGGPAAFLRRRPCRPPPYPRPYIRHGQRARECRMERAAALRAGSPPAQRPCRENLVAD